MGAYQPAPATVNLCLWPSSANFTSTNHGSSDNNLDR